MKEKYVEPIVVSMKELDKSIGKGNLPNSNGNFRFSSSGFSTNSNRAYS